MAFPMAGLDTSAGNDNSSGGAPQTESTGNIPGVHSSWNEMLSSVPPEYHQQMIPHLQKWEQNTNKVHQRYEPYKRFAENGVDAGYMEQAVNIARVLENDPRAVYDLLHEQFGNVAPTQQQQIPQSDMPQQQGTGQGLPGNTDNPYEGYDLPPALLEKMQRLEGGFDTVAEIILAQKQSTEEQEQDAQLDALYQQFEQQNPVFAALNDDGLAEPYVNSLLQAGYKDDEVMQMFNKFAERAGQYYARPRAPQLLGSGGGVPSGQAVDPRKMTSRQTRDYVAQTLEAAKYANQ